MAGEPRLGVGGVALAEFSGVVVEGVGELVGDGWGAGGGALRPRRWDAGVGQLEALEAAVEDAGDGPGAVHRSVGDLVDDGVDVVSGELRLA